MPEDHWELEETEEWQPARRANMPLWLSVVGLALYVALVIAI